MSLTSRIIGWIIVIVVGLLAIFGVISIVKAYGDKRVEMAIASNTTESVSEAPISTATPSTVTPVVTATPEPAEVASTDATPAINVTAEPTVAPAEPTETPTVTPVVTATPEPAEVASTDATPAITVTAEPTVAPAEPTETPASEEASLPKTVEVDEVSLWGRVLTNTYVYKGPDTRYDAVKAVDENDVVQIVGKVDGWFCYLDQNSKYYFIEENKVVTANSELELASMNSTSSDSSNIMIEGMENISATDKAVVRMGRAITTSETPLYSDGNTRGNAIATIAKGTIVWVLEVNGETTAIRYEYQGKQVVAYATTANLASI